MSSILESQAKKRERLCLTLLLVVCRAWSNASLLVLKITCVLTGFSFYRIESRLVLPILLCGLIHDTPIFGASAETPAVATRSAENQKQVVVQCYAKCDSECDADDDNPVSWQ